MFSCIRRVIKSQHIVISVRSTVRSILVLISKKAVLAKNQMFRLEMRRIRKPVFHLSKTNFWKKSTDLVESILVFRPRFMI